MWRACMFFKGYDEVKNFLEHKKLIVASNRGPLKFNNSNGQLFAKKGSGGLVSTLTPLMDKVGGTWISAAMSAIDKGIANDFSNKVVPKNLHGLNFDLQFVSVDQQVYDDYYDVFSNSILWYIHHKIYKINSYTPYNLRNVWFNGYVPANQSFAEGIITRLRENNENSIVMLQDYHLYLVPEFIRKKIRDKIFLNQFIHVPWPNLRYFKLLPDYIFDSIMSSLLKNDLIGFQTPEFADNFLKSCEEFADEVDFEKGAVQLNGQKTLVKSYPISIDVSNIKKMAKQKDVHEFEKVVKEIKNDNFLIYRTDRADITKNIIRGLLGYELFLNNHPEYLGKIKFLITGSSTRENLVDYQNYRNTIEEIIERINWKYSNNDWKPVVEIFNPPYAFIIAAFKNYDCLMVNSICDGMNVVSKEGPILNEENGSLILSEKAGSYNELEGNVLEIDPFSIQETADAIYFAVKMDNETRKRNIMGLKKTINKNTLSNWIFNQINDIKKNFS
jgi:trehalose 6-phosphate synthase